MSSEEALQEPAAITEVRTISPTRRGTSAPRRVSATVIFSVPDDQR
jgi:hypothetical protein